MGASLWIDRARAELERTNVGPSQGTILTPTEQRIAELATSGMTNRDVAATLFISLKTVEANLTQIYRKLGNQVPRPARPEAEVGLRLRVNPDFLRTDLEYRKWDEHGCPRHDPIPGGVVSAKPDAAVD